MPGKRPGKKRTVTVRGPWVPVPLNFLRSLACARLSPLAVKLLVDLCAGLGPNADGNGDLSASPSTMGLRGWTSNATLAAAMRELIDAGLVIVTRRGDRRRCTLFAVTLWPLQCDTSKLDHGPGAYSTADWEASGREPPSTAEPAVWNRPRKNTSSPPAAGEPSRVVPPSRVNLQAPARSNAPVAGAKAGLSSAEVPPQRDTFLDVPSVASSAARRRDSGRPSAIRAGRATANAAGPVGRALASQLLSPAFLAVLDESARAALLGPGVTTDRAHGDGTARGNTDGS